MTNTTKTITKILSFGVGMITSGTAASGLTIKNQIDINTKENNKTWFNESKNDGSHYKFTVNSVKEKDPWIKNYEMAKKDYDFSKSYRDNYSLDYMEKGWQEFRNFCYEGLADLQSKGINPHNALLNSSFEEWAEKREYWLYCVNVKI